MDELQEHEQQLLDGLVIDDTFWNIKEVLCHQTRYTNGQQRTELKVS